MPFEARVLSVLIASPGDTVLERDAVEAAIRSWNSDRSRRDKVVFLPLRWEFDSRTELGGGDAQAVVNRQLVEQADIIVGMFHSRLGQSTSRGASGTAEEILQGVERGVPTHVYFADMPHPSDLDIEQLTALRDFKNSLNSQGLLGRYVSPDDLAAKVRADLDRDTAALAPPNDEDSGVSEQGRAVVRVRHEEAFAGVSRSPSHRLVLENIGDAAAEDVKAKIESTGEGRDPQILIPLEVERLLPNTAMRFPLILTLGTSVQWKVSYSWRENGEEYIETQSLNAF
ncbi:hypothetical protein EDD99_4376 [Streptomyces sp. 846.5]|nr:hypothetical protein [Streptomyces sp. 846.5]TDU05842.1 hypothetical protein EDD99_4376 [Streptomyces sp. 846.5]